MKNLTSLRGLAWLTIAFFAPLVWAEIGDTATAEKIKQQNAQWQKAIADFAVADADTVIAPYMQLIARLNSQPQRSWCTPDVLSMVNQAIKLNPSSLVAHSMLFSCAAKQRKLTLRDQYTETINGLISNLIDTKEATSIESVIEIRELMEARLLLQAMGYSVLDMNLVTRFGGLYYQFHVIDTQTNKITTRYFSNLHFMKNLLSNPDVSDDMASQLMTQYYQSQNMPFAITEQAARFISRGQYQKAEEVLLTLGEYSMTANVQLAQIYLNTGQTDKLNRIKRDLELDAKSGFIPPAIMLAQLMTTQTDDSKQTTQQVEAQIKALLERIDHFTVAGEGAFELAIALKKSPEHSKLSLQWFEKAVKQNHPKATLALALLYRLGTVVKADDKKAFELFEKANQLGVKEAAVELALYYHQGSDFAAADHKKEIALLQKLAEQKAPVALYMLAQRYDNGVDVTQDHQQAFELYQQAFEHGERKAANQIGILFETARIGAIDSKPDLTQAYNWYEKAGFKGDSNGFSNLARFHHYGVGRKVSLPQAANYYVRAAETGSHVAYCKLADTMLEMELREGNKWQDTLARAKSLYLFGAKKEGKVCPRQLGYFYQVEMNDSQKAEHWYEIAASNGDTQALKRLELVYFDTYMRKNYAQAFTNFNKGHQLGLVKSTYFLGQLYHQGLGVTRDDSQALKHFQAVHKQGYNPAEKAIALLYFQGQDSVKNPQKARQMFDDIAARSLNDTLNVAEWFFYGQDTKVNYQQARIYYEQAAKQGSGSALNHLGEIYRFGWGVEIDYDKAMDWYKKANDINYRLAAHNIAEMHYLGTGIKKDYSQALHWFAKAAKLGISHSQYYLGLMHQKGQGVEQSDEHANEWFFLAMDQRHEGAKFELGKNMIEGKGVAKQPAKGLLFITEAAEGGYQQAIDYLELMPGVQVLQ